MRFHKSGGLTASEQILAQLCERSFLKLWTYPNLYKKPAKELVDLAVIFQKNILLFSDKSCAFPNTGNPELDWSRWFRAAISDSAHQLHQAERWLRTQPHRVFLDAKASEPLPITLPDMADANFHRVCVVTGAADRCIAATGRPSLAIDMAVTDDERALAVGRVSEGHGWVHVFDEQSLQVLLTELDTIADFVAYLDAKVTLFEGGQFRSAPSEPDILAQYIWNGRSFPPADQPFTLLADQWVRVIADPAFQAGKAENEISTFWDGLIEYVTDHFLGETLEFGNGLEMGDYERLVRIMAQETRFHRRILATEILQRADRAREGKIGSLLPSAHPDVVYALLIGPGAPPGEYAAYRTDRTRELLLRCHAAKAARPECRYIIGIGLDARGGVNGGSEDFIYLDTEAWTEADLERAQRMRIELQYFIPGVAIETRVVVDEYPGSI